MIASGILYTLLTALLWTGVAACYRGAGKSGIPLLSLGLLISFCITILSFLIVLPRLDSPFNTERLLPLIVVISLAGMLAQSGMIMLARAMSLGHSAVTWVIVQSAIIVSFMFSIFFLHEPAKIHHICGVIVLIVSFGFHARRSSGGTGCSGEHTFQWALLTGLSFLCVGGGQCLILQTAHWKDLGAEASLRIPISFCASGLLFAAVSFFKRVRPTGRVFRFALPMSAVIVAGQFTLYIAADMMAGFNLASVVFPVSIGGSILGFALYSRIFLKEHFSKRTWVGIVLNTAAIVMLAVP